MQGIGCNLVNPNDTANFLLFLQEFRRTVLGRSLILSAAVYVTPFVDASGSPSTDVSGFADVLDYIAIMNYDIKSNTAIGAGPSSPLDDSCAPSGAKWGSAASSVAAWSKAGIPTNKLVLGVAAYGHSYAISSSVALNRTDASSLVSFPSYNPSNRKVGDRWDGPGGLDVCGVTQGPGGVYTYWGLIEAGFLKTDGSASDGVVSRYDECSETVCEILTFHFFLLLPFRNPFLVMQKPAHDDLISSPLRTSLLTKFTSRTKIRDPLRQRGTSFTRLAWGDSPCGKLEVIIMTLYWIPSVRPFIQMKETLLTLHHRERIALWKSERTNQA